MKRLSKVVRVALRELSPESRAIFRDFVAVNQIHDIGGQQILLDGLPSRETANACKQIIEQEGRMLSDRFGQRRPHPLCTVERDARAAWLSALRALNLAVGEPPKIGRPEGS